MLLFEIADNPNETIAELSVLLKSFPNKGRDMIEHMRNKPHKLKYGGYDIYDESGFGPAIDGLTHAFKESMEKGEVLVQYTFDLKKKHELLLPIRDANLVWVGYSPNNNKILLGYDAWVNEDSFSEEFDKAFEADFEEEFDYENDEHREIYDPISSAFNSQGFYGLVIEADYDGYKPMIDVVIEAPKGFFKGAKSMLAPNVIDL